MTTNKTSWLRLARAKNIGPKSFFELLTHFHSVESILAEISAINERLPSAQKIILPSLSEVEKELELTEKFSAEILLFSDPQYPQLLREIADPPPLITVKGRTDLLKKNSIAVVGARNASLNSINFAKKIAHDLSSESIVITSGLARGIDSSGHVAALKNGTIAVIAGGINHIYPKENQRLFEEIAKQGLIISENRFGQSPQGYNFIQRNRIISGISLATLVVEASLRSGSLSTARFALEQGREVFAVPGSPLDPRCRGTNNLIRQGAKMVEEVKDILEELNFSVENLLSSEVSPNQAKSDIDEVGKAILEKLSFTPIAVEELIAKLEMPTSLINQYLMRFELEDKIAVEAGNVWLR
jgi:DNA processing protein